MPDKTINNFEGLSGSRPTLVQCEPIQPLDGRLNIILSPELLHKFGRKSEDGEQFHCHLHQNGFQGLGKRDLGINTESAEELVEGREQIYERVVTRTNIFDRLRDVTEMCRWDRRMRDIRRVGWQCQ
jgi:hypothetical protein